MNALRRKPIVVFVFLAAMAFVQFAAMLRQFQHGFVPFRTLPVRVPFSWDMFGLQIARCDVEWTPPLPARGGVQHLRDLGAFLEWDPIYNVPEAYFAAARAGCTLRHTPTVVRVMCMTAQGRLERGFECP
jgi:hypothetical protein